MTWGEEKRPRSEGSLTGKAQSQRGAEPRGLLRSSFPATALSAARSPIPGKAPLPTITGDAAVDGRGLLRGDHVVARHGEAGGGETDDAEGEDSGNAERSLQGPLLPLAPVRNRQHQSAGVPLRAVHDGKRARREDYGPLYQRESALFRPERSKRILEDGCCPYPMRVRARTYQNPFIV